MGGEGLGVALCEGDLRGWIISGGQAGSFARPTSLADWVSNQYVNRGMEIGGNSGLQLATHYCNKASGPPSSSPPPTSPP